MLSHGDSTHIVETVKSILAQTYQNWELLFVAKTDDNESLKPFSLLREEDIKIQKMASLSKASCESSIHSYECGSPELIAIYNAMLTTDGIYGGRFSGAGFKGACIAIVDPAKKESIEKEITEKYLGQIPQYRNTFKVYFCKSDDGNRFV